MTQHYGTQSAIDFLSGTGTDAKGRTISDYKRFTDEEWEACHDHIQWAFPSDIPSDFNPNAPLIDFADERWIVARTNPVVRDNVFALLKAYLKSICLISPESTSVAPYFTREVHFQNNFLTPGNHNYRRITRILHFLAMSEMSWEAWTPYQIGLAFDTIALAHAKIYGTPRRWNIDQATLDFWEYASIGKLHSFLQQSAQ